MNDDEYRLVRRSVVMTSIVAIGFGVLGFLASALGYTQFLGAIPSFIFGFFFGLVLGNKLFPDTSKYLTTRRRNYQRIKAGKAPIEDEDPETEYNSDIGRG